MAQSSQVYVQDVFLHQLQYSVMFSPDILHTRNNENCTQLMLGVISLYAKV